MYPKPIDLWTVLGAGFIGAGFWTAIQEARRRSVEEHRCQQERLRQMRESAWNRMLRHNPPGIPTGIGKYCYSMN